MVKHPQATLGYAVNGVIVFKPKRRVSEDNGTDLSPKKSRKELKIAARRSQCERKRIQRSKGHLRELLRFQPQMEDLKNACKQNDLVGALLAAHTLSGIAAITTAATGSAESNHLLLLIRILFTPDIEGRSGIYYAAHTGRAEMVKMFLALLVLERAWRRNGRASSKLNELADFTQEKTMLGWLEHFGFPRNFFSRSEFDLCILNALNDRTKEVFRQTKFSWEDVTTLVKSLDQTTGNRLGKCVFLELCRHDQTQRQVLASARKRYPQVCLDDDFSPKRYTTDELDADEYYSSDEDEESVTESDDSPDPINHVAEEVVDSSIQVDDRALPSLETSTNLNKFTLVDFHERRVVDLQRDSNQGIWEESRNDIESKWTDLDSSAECDSAWTHLGDKNGFHFVPDTDDFVWNDEIEIEMSVVNKDELSCVASEWDIVQDSSSVISLDSDCARKSYLEALLENHVQITGNGRGFQKASRRPRDPHNLPKVGETDTEQDEQEEDDGIVFDACFDLECTKGARGGKKDRMFKGEGRSRRWYRYR